MNYGISNLSIVPMRNEAADQSEMVNQVIFGEHFKVLEIRKKWSKVRLAHDSYEGWICNKQNQESQIKRVSRRRKQANRMFTIKNGPGPNVTTTEDAKPILGDNYTVTGRDYPFGGKIDE